MALSHEEAKRVLDFKPKTGEFRWKVSNSNRVRAGDIAGSVCRLTGYRLIGVHGVLYRANRLAWFWMTGEWPNGQVDHANGHRADDSWRNLRVATPQQNTVNSKRQSNNTSGFKGVHKHGSRFRARLRRHGKSFSLGVFNTAEEAHAAYRVVADRYDGEFARVE